MRRLTAFFSVAVLILSTGSVHANMTVINFDSLAPGTIVDNQFSSLGADFNGDATVVGSLTGSFPSHSGSEVIFNFPSNNIRIDAVGPEWLMAGGYVTGTDSVTLTAYNSSDILLGAVSTIGANTVGYGTPNIFLNVSAPNIAYVEFSILSGNTFTVDDFTFNPVPVPAAVLLGMLGLGVAGLRLHKFK